MNSLSTSLPHSSFDAELQALDIAIRDLSRVQVNKATFLIDNKNAARAIWETSPHNLQFISIRAMANFRQWVSSIHNHDNLHIQIPWCPSHKEVLENEYVDSLAEQQLLLANCVVHSTVNSTISNFKKDIYEKWDSAIRQFNNLGHGFLRPKFKNKRIGPSYGKRKNIFFEITDDNINGTIEDAGIRRKKIGVDLTKNIHTRDNTSYADITTNLTRFTT
ncbi:hypothetical protein AX15_007882 [Amanita polypyramis BW_CC]|nr:hypothetical protein AX15_007882 [Amanita polypyramis BW_CC]